MRRGIVVHPDEMRVALIDRMAASGLNTLGLHPVGGENAAQSLAQAIAWRKLPETEALFQYAYAKGICVEFEAHALSWLLPREKFAENPSWFRMNEHGERTPDVNFCPSNADALAYISNRTAALAAYLPTNSHRYFYWMDDVAGKKCMCKKCQSLSASDQQLITVNAMLKGLKRVDPEAKIAYIAYLDALHPPKNVQKATDVFLEYAPFKRDPDAPMNDPSNEKNASEAAALPALLTFFGTENAQVLEYWMDNSMYSGWKKPPKAFALRGHIMAQDVPFYRALGFADLTSFGCFLGLDYEKLHGKAPIEEYAKILQK